MYKKEILYNVYKLEITCQEHDDRVSVEWWIIMPDKTKQTFDVDIFYGECQIFFKESFKTFIDLIIVKFYHEVDKLILNKNTYKQLFTELGFVKVSKIKTK